MLEYLVIHNNFVTTVYTGAIDDMKCQILQFNLDQHLLHKTKKTIDNIRVRINVPILQLRYIRW